MKPRHDYDFDDLADMGTVSLLLLGVGLWLGLLCFYLAACVAGVWRWATRWAR